MKPDRPAPAFVTKVIAFVDIVGFSRRVEQATDADLPELLALMAMLGSPLDVARFQHGFPFCPSADHVDRLLDFKVTQVSDCVVVSAECSPAGVVNLVGYCWNIATAMLAKGYLCRGAIVIGPVFHEGITIVGEAYQRAVRREKEVRVLSSPGVEFSSGGPFIEVAEDVLAYVAQLPDQSVRRMFQNMVHEDASGAAIYPFHAVAESHAATVTKDFDPDRWIASVSAWRARWTRQREDLATEQRMLGPKEQAKIAHVIGGIDHIIRRADDRLSSLEHMKATGRRPREGTSWGLL